jgi:hypothetical protein
VTNPDRSVHGREACAAIALTVLVISLVIGVALMVAPR